MKLTHWMSGVALAGGLAVSAALPAHAAMHEKVTLTDANGAMKVIAAKKTLKAGKVTFDVTNLPTSASEHEMIVAKLTKAQEAHPDQLPYDENAARVYEEKINDRGEVSELQPGHSGSLTLELKPGAYILFCNVPGHYKSGMYTVVHVTGTDGNS